MYIYYYFYKDELLYIGSTENIIKREAKHRSDLKCGSTSSIYVYLRESNLLIDNLEKEIILTELTDRDELYLLETKLIEIYNPIYNSNSCYIPGRTGAEYREEHKEEIAEYYQEHKEEIAEYYQEHKEQLLEYQKKYNEEHKEEIANYKSQYYQDKKEQLLEKSKLYNEEHKEERLEYQRQYRLRKKQEKLISKATVII